jgi:hypothetical protein
MCLLGRYRHSMAGESCGLDRFVSGGAGGASVRPPYAAVGCCDNTYLSCTLWWSLGGYIWVPLPLSPGPGRALYRWAVFQGVATSFQCEIGCDVRDERFCGVFLEVDGNDKRLWGYAISIFVQPVPRAG